MLVPSMNSAEIFIELNKDFDNVLRKIEYLMPQIRRKQIKSKTKEVKIILDYKSPRKNEWILLIRRSKKGHGISGFAYVKGDMNFYMIGADGKTLHHYSPHFVKRYQERFLKETNLSLSEVMKKYIVNNDQAVAYVPGDGKFYSTSIEGVSLGYIEDLTNGRIVFHDKTFISEEMLREEQKDLSKDLLNKLADYQKEIKANYGLKC